MNDSRQEALERIATARAEEVAADVGQVEAQLTAEPDDADRRLAAADRVLAEARELAGATDPTQAQEAARAKVRRGIDAMYEGDADEAAAALTEVMVPDPKRLAAEVRRELDKQDALQEFKAKFPEILSDLTLAQMADGYYAQARAAGKSERESFDEAGRSARAHLRKLGAELGIVAKDEEHGNGTGDVESDASAVICEMQRTRPGFAIPTKGGNHA